MPSLRAHYLGTVPYCDALARQKWLQEARANKDIPDTLLLLQHLPVLTKGRFRGGEDLLVSPEKLAAEGIEVLSVDRGGSMTYHGPGQLVGYPIMELSEKGLGIKEYIWKLEEVIIKFLRTLNISAHRKPEYLAGVWVESKKICSIGVSVSRHVAMHGFALNVCTDLSHFALINPCGITAGNVMTSISQVIGRRIEVEDLTDDVIAAFAEEFNMTLERDPAT